MISFKKSASLLLGSILITSLCYTTSYGEEKSAVETLTDIAQKAEAVVGDKSLGELFNINNASPEMLAKVPGVGEKLSQAIVAYRENNGLFKQVQDLLKVDGIDASLLEKIKPFLQL